MFHHFFRSWDSPAGVHPDFEKHPKGQGAISSFDLIAMIRHLQQTYIILDAQEWMYRIFDGTIHDGHICLSFDDALLCQYEIALPVLEEFDIKAFWFIYSSVFQGNVEPLEVFRYFRTVAFDSIDDFYDEFYKWLLCMSYSDLYSQGLANFDEKYLTEFPYYTRPDRVFRHFRDNILGDKYDEMMWTMIDKRGYSKADLHEKLWMTDDQLKTLDAAGHIIGLHSYSHPIRMERMSVDDQRCEYGANHTHLGHLLQKPPKAMSHPCNSYNKDTLDILKMLGVQIGFCANMSPIKNRSVLEFAREDHSNVMKEMESAK